MSQVTIELDGKRATVTSLTWTSDDPDLAALLNECCVPSEDTDPLPAYVADWADECLKLARLVFPELVLVERVPDPPVSNRAGVVW